MATILVRFATYLDLMLLFGAAAFATLGGAGRWEPGRRWIVTMALLGLLLSALGVLGLAAGMAGIPLAQLDRQTIGTILALPTIALPIAIRAAALIATLLCLALPGAWRRWGLCLCSGLALATLGAIGHGAIDAGAMGWIHLGADIVHLWAAALWIGAIVILLGLAIQALRHADTDSAQAAWRAAADFAFTGTLLVGAIVLTGAVNALAIIGWGGLPALLSTPYGRLLIAKLLLFAAMLALAAANRFRHVPRLGAAIGRGESPSALARLKHSLIAEAACGIAILALVAWLGTLDPSAVN